MAQLIVRRIEEEVVRALRARAATSGVSSEEEHRRILREALLGTRHEPRTLKEHLALMPDVGDDPLFERPGSAPRPVGL